MQYATPAELLQQLLDACNDGNHGATRLAEQTEIEALRSFLHESAHQYRLAAEDLRAAGIVDPSRRRPRGRAPLEAPQGDDDIAATWERAECEALTHFRDAFDMADGVLPSPVAETVKRHYEAGVSRLERLRRLQSRLS